MVKVGEGGEKNAETRRTKGLSTSMALPEASLDVESILLKGKCKRRIVFYGQEQKTGTFSNL